MKDDAARIKRLGGPARLAEILGYSEPGGTQRVHNWTKRGIPSFVKVERPDLFLVPISALKGKTKAAPEQAKAEA